MNKNVLIAGAGPVGLAMAADLVRYGVSVRLVEKAPERTDKSKKGAHAALSSAAWHEIRIGMTKANRRSISRARESSDHTAEVATAEAGIFVCEHVCFHVSKSGLRLAFYTVVEGLENIFFEMDCTRERLYDGVAV